MPVKSGVTKRPNRDQVLDILSRYRAAGTERERRKVANSVKNRFPLISERLSKLINEESQGKGETPASDSHSKQFRNMLEVARVKFMPRKRPVPKDRELIFCGKRGGIIVAQSAGEKDL